MRHHALLAGLLLHVCVSAVRAQWMPWFGGGGATTGDSFGQENYSQCGGMGGACSPSSGGCIDGVWPGAQCKAGKCVRNTAYHWMCKPDKLPYDVSGNDDRIKKEKAEALAAIADKSGRQSSRLAPGASSSFSNKGSSSKDDASSNTSKANDLLDDSTIRLWAQCGGDGGKCKDYGAGQCRDCAFEGYKCQDKAVCGRVMQGFWQCGPDNRMKAGAECAPIPKPEPAPAPGTALAGKCKAPQLGQEVDGTYMETLYLQDPNRRMFYMECCGYCTATQGCVAFQVNVFSQNASTCDMFTTYKGVMPGSATTAAGVMTAADVAVAIAG